MSEKNDFVIDQITHAGEPKRLMNYTFVSQEAAIIISALSKEQAYQVLKEVTKAPSSFALSSVEGI